MDNVDSIMIMSLRQAGCSIDEEIVSCSEFTPELLITCCATILNRIDESLELSLNVPPEGPRRFRYCSQLVSAMKKNGYRDDCRYDLFNYPNPQDTRKFLTFLIERLPRNEQDNNDEAVEDTDLLGKMKESIRQGYYQSWFLPPLQKPQPRNQFVRHFLQPYPSLSDQEVQAVWEDANEAHGNERTETRKMAKQVVVRMLGGGVGSGGASSSLSAFRQQLSDLSRTLGGRFVHVTKFAQEKEEVTTVNADNIETKEQREKEEREAKMKELEEDLDKYTQALHKCDEQLEEEAERQQELVKRGEQGKREKGVLEGEIRTKDIIVKMLDDPEQYQAKLEEMNEKTMKKIQRIQGEWEEHRSSLIAEYHNTMEKARGTQSKSFQMQAQVKSQKEEMQKLLETARAKQTHLLQMRQEYQGMDRASDRAVYVAKITDLHRTLSAQKKDIDSIINDVRTLMTDSDSAEDRLSRVFRDADDLIFKAANNTGLFADKEHPAKAIYAGLISIHQNYRKLFLAYEELGKLANSMLVIKDRIDDQLQYDTEKKMEKLQKDYNDFIAENQELRKKIEELDMLAQY